MNPVIYRLERDKTRQELQSLLASAYTEEDLVAFFRQPAAFRHFGSEGDRMGWTPEQTARYFAKEPVEHYNSLSPAEAERLAILMEEMAEAQHIIGKILRHGYESYHPDKPDVDNRQLLERELGDVQEAVLCMAKAGDVHSATIDEHANKRRFQRIPYKHHN